MTKPFSREDFFDTDTIRLVFGKDYKSSKHIIEVLQKQHPNHKVRFLSYPSSLKGLKKVFVYYFGDYNMREDFSAVQRELELLHKSGRAYGYIIQNGRAGDTQSSYTAEFIKGIE